MIAEICLVAIIFILLAHIYLMAKVFGCASVCETRGSLNYKADPRFFTSVAALIRPVGHRAKYTKHMTDFMDSTEMGSRLPRCKRCDNDGWDVEGRVWKEYSAHEGGYKGRTEIHYEVVGIWCGKCGKPLGGKEEK